MGDANDLNYENVLPKNSKIMIISESNKLKEFPSETFVRKLENLVGNKVISHKRIIQLTHDTLREIGKTSGMLSEYGFIMNNAFDIAQRYFTSINYSETERGYVLQK
jgi:hypothetical protein